MVYVLSMGSNIHAIPPQGGTVVAGATLLSFARLPLVRKKSAPLLPKECGSTDEMTDTSSWCQLDTTWQT